MRRAKTVVAVAGGALAVAAGATALAAPGGGPAALFEDHAQRTQDARALGEKLSVDPGRVSRAMEEVARERRQEHEDEMAAALANRLDVSTADAKRALQKAFAGLRPENGERPPAAGERPRPDHPEARLARAIAEELGKSPAEVKAALRAIRTERLRAHLAQAVKAGRLTSEQAHQIEKRAEEGHRGGFGPPPGGRGHGHGPGGPGPDHGPGGLIPPQRPDGAGGGM